MYNHCDVLYKNKTYQFNENALKESEIINVAIAFNKEKKFNLNFFLDEHYDFERAIEMYIKICDQFPGTKFLKKNSVTDDIPRVPNYLLREEIFRLDSQTLYKMIELTYQIRNLELLNALLTRILFILNREYIFPELMLSIISPDIITYFLDNFHSCIDLHSNDEILNYLLNNRFGFDCQDVTFLVYAFNKYTCIDVNEESIKEFIAACAKRTNGEVLIRQIIENLYFGNIFMSMDYEELILYIVTEYKVDLNCNFYNPNFREREYIIAKSIENNHDKLFDYALKNTDINSIKPKYGLIYLSILGDNDHAFTKLMTLGLSMTEKEVDDIFNRIHIEHHYLKYLHRIVRIIPNVDKVDSSGHTYLGRLLDLLTYSKRYNDTEKELIHKAIKQLITFGAQTNKKTFSFDLSPLDIANNHRLYDIVNLMEMTHLNGRSKNTFETCGEKIKVKSKPVIKMNTEELKSIFWDALKNKNVPMMRKCIAKNENVINSSDENGTMPLGYLALYTPTDTRLGMVNVLLHAGASPNMKDYYGRGPLYNALTHMINVLHREETPRSEKKSNSMDVEEHYRRSMRLMQIFLLHGALPNTVVNEYEANPECFYNNYITDYYIDFNDPERNSFSALRGAQYIGNQTILDIAMKTNFPINIKKDLIDMLVRHGAIEYKDPNDRRLIYPGRPSRFK